MVGGVTVAASDTIMFAPLNSILNISADERTRAWVADVIWCTKWDCQFRVAEKSRALDVRIAGALADFAVAKVKLNSKQQSTNTTRVQIIEMI